MEAKPSLDNSVEWRKAIWKPAVEDALQRAKKFLPENSNILELGYYSGAMSCYLADQFGWNITGYEIRKECVEMAQANAKKFNLTDKLEFNYLPANQTFSITQQYDGIFLKSFLYHIKTWEDYEKWVRWLYSRLKPNGVLIAIENGRGTLLDRAYRKKINFGSTWKASLLHQPRSEKILNHVFDQTEIEYFGFISQYFTASPNFSKFLQKLEKKFIQQNSSNSFIASITARRRPAL